MNESSTPNKACSKCGVVKPAKEEFFVRTTRDKSGLQGTCKSCRSVYKRAYNKQNSKQISANNKIYNKANSEKRNANHKIYNKANFEKISANQKIYRKANSEKISANQKIYREANPEAARSAGRRRRARKLENGFENYTEGQVLDFFGTNCYLCKTPINLEISRKPGIEGWQKGLHIDHVIPISKGGPDTLENVRPSHAQCNLIKGSRTAKST